MELKPGYKQTEVGIIPADWDAKQIGGEIDLLTGHPFPSSGYSESGIRLLRGSNVKRGETDWNEEITQYWPSASPEIVRYELMQGDLVIAMDGSLVGRSYAKLSTADLPALLLQRVARIRSKKLDVAYLTAFVGSDCFIKYADSVKTVTAIPHISPGDIRKFTIPIPPTLLEQNAIATALSDVDALLDGLDRLIAKKRDLKQAAMQQLLTGKTRLPGFEGEWEVRFLADVCWFQEGPGVRNYQFTNSGVKLFNGTNIEHGRIDLEKTNRFISEKEAYGWYSHFLADVGDIVIACSGITIDKFEQKVSVIEEAHLPICMNTSTMRFKAVSAQLHNPFLLHFLRSSQFKKQIGGSATGSAQLNFGPSHVQKIFIDLPTIKEQTAIATVLSDMDAEIAAVEQRRHKTKDIKQAMMQELLTGKTRLV